MHRSGFWEMLLLIYPRLNNCAFPVTGLSPLGGGENCYGKCDDCLELGVRSFIHAHARVLGPISGPVVHDERPPEANTGEGDPMAGSPEPGANSGGGSMNSFFLSLAPDFFCRRCGGAFRPFQGSECNSLCMSCSSLAFLRSPPPKRRRLGGEGFGPPT